MCTTHVVIVMGADGLESPVNEQFCHRPEVIQDLLGLNWGERLSPIRHRGTQKLLHSVFPLLERFGDGRRYTTLWRRKRHCAVLPRLACNDEAERDRVSQEKFIDLSQKRRPGALIMTLTGLLEKDILNEARPGALRGPERDTRQSSHVKPMPMRISTPATSVAAGSWERARPRATPGSTWPPRE